VEPTPAIEVGLKKNLSIVFIFQSKNPRNSEIDISQSRLLPAGSLVGSFPFVAMQLRKVDRSRMSIMLTAIFATMMW